jgi:hypothetical protein
MCSSTSHCFCSISRPPSGPGARGQLRCAQPPRGLRAPVGDTRTHTRHTRVQQHIHMHLLARSPSGVLPLAAQAHTHTRPLPTRARVCVPVPILPIHSVGRTGRAGNKGTAITFISDDEERYAPDLVKALRESGAPIPQDLQARGRARVWLCTCVGWGVGVCVLATGLLGMATHSSAPLRFCAPIPPASARAWRSS